MTTENIVELAQTALETTLVPFVSAIQRDTLTSLLHGEEGEGFAESVLRLDETIKTMPKTYETDGQVMAAVVYLHYFLGSYDAWITEKDRGDDTNDLSQHQAYGSASFSGREDAELGYISIEELTQNEVEIDLHWTPKSLKEI
jgi:hypothetical protein